MLESVMGGEMAAAANWASYRLVRDTVSGTWELLQNDPTILTRALTP